MQVLGKLSQCQTRARTRCTRRLRVLIIYAMTLHTGILRCSSALWILSIILAGIVFGQSDPKSEISFFDDFPARIFFFHDTDVCMSGIFVVSSAHVI